MNIHFACVALCAVMAAASAAQAAEIKLIASNAVKEAYGELIPAFEKASGHKVTVAWVGTSDAMDRVMGGEVADIVIIPSNRIDDLIAKGKLVQGSRIDLVKSIIGVAVRVGAPRPDLSSWDSLKTYLLTTKKIVLSGGPSGVYLADLFQKKGVGRELAAKTITLPPGAASGDVLARGEAEIGFTQVSEFLHIKNIDFIGPAPADIQQVTVFSAGMERVAPQPEAAKALLKYLTAPAVVPVLKKNGLEPGA